MDRRSQQNHIRAARDWLGRAEDSLAREDDVQGDLKLMLAKAELAHVGQSSRSRFLSLWGRRGAALLLAFALAGGVLWKSGPIPAQVEEAVPALPQQAAAEHPAAPAEAEPAAEKLPQAVGATVREKNAAPQPQAAHEPEQAARPAVPVPEQAQAPAVKPVPQPPDMEKQQLMQSAGKILRQ